MRPSFASFLFVISSYFAVVQPHHIGGHKNNSAQVRRASLSELAVTIHARAALPYARIKATVGDKAINTCKTLHVANFGSQCRCRKSADASSQRVVSLDVVVGDGDMPRSGLLDNGEPGVEDMVLDGVQREELAKLVDELDPISAALIRRRYGLEDGRQQSYDEIATALDRTRPRLKQMEQKAIEQLRQLAAA